MMMPAKEIRTSRRRYTLYQEVNLPPDAPYRQQTGRPGRLLHIKEALYEPDRDIVGGEVVILLSRAMSLAGGRRIQTFSW